MSVRSGLPRRLGRASYGRLAPVRPAPSARPGLAGPAGPGQALSGPRRGRLRGLARQAVGRRSPLRHYDWLLLAATAALIGLGTLLIWSATASSPAHPAADPYLRKQLLNIIIGLILLLAVSLLDKRRIRAFAPALYAASLLSLLAVLSPLGIVVNGSRSWFSLPAGFEIEPSEFAKLGLILMVAVIVGRLRAGGVRPGPGAALLAAAVAAVPIALVAAQPDLGVTVLMLAMLAGMTAVSGLRLRWLAGLAGAGALGVFAVFHLHLLKAYQLARLASFLHPSADPSGTGYSAAQAKIAIGSGGAWGQGLFHGPLIAGNFVPEKQTDFIFAVAGEELGFAGAIAIIALLAIVLLRALRIAARADDQFGMLVAAGIAIWFAVQAFINIGMTVGLMPVTGLPLPFVSYGGSAMFADMIAVGILESIHRRRILFAG